MVRNVARARPERLRHGLDFRFQQNDVRRLARDVAGPAHGNAEIGLRERGRVVDAVAHKRHALALCLKFFYKFRLLLRPDLGKYIYAFDADLSGDARGGQ